MSEAALAPRLFAPQCPGCTLSDVQTKYSCVFSWAYVVRRPSSHQTFLTGREVVYSLSQPQGRSCPCTMAAPHVLSVAPPSLAQKRGAAQTTPTDAVFFFQTRA